MKPLRHEDQTHPPRPAPPDRHGHRRHVHLQVPPLRAHPGIHLARNLQMPERRQHDESTVMPPNGQRTSHPHQFGWVREKGVGQMKVWPTLRGSNPAGSIAPFKEGFPRAIQHSLDPRKCGNRREILTSFDALPIPRTEPGPLRRLLLRDTCLDPHGRNISPETCATGTGHRLFRWHGRYRLENENHATRGFTSFSENATPSWIPPNLMPTEYEMRRLDEIGPLMVFWPTQFSAPQLLRLSVAPRLKLF